MGAMQAAPYGAMHAVAYGCDATNGCKAGCPTVADATCDTCSDSSTCTAVTCNANYFNDDGDATNGWKQAAPQWLMQCQLFR